jgi:hypothetical protein
LFFDEWLMNTLCRPAVDGRAAGVTGAAGGDATPGGLGGVPGRNRGGFGRRGGMNGDHGTSGEATGGAIQTTRSLPAHDDNPSWAGRHGAGRSVGLRLPVSSTPRCCGGLLADECRHPAGGLGPSS